MSRRLWDLDWHRILPWELDSGVRCEPASFREFSTFAERNGDRIFDGGARLHPERPSRAKQRYFQQADFFAFRDGERTIGFNLAHPTDWSTYYLRTAAILPEHQDRRVVTEWLIRTAEVLKQAGVARFETETAPANHRAVNGLNRLGFIVTATSQTERWGVLLRMTRYLDGEAERAFAERFCHGGGLLRRPHLDEKHAQEKEVS